jgi:hypothetical protein
MEGGGGDPLMSHLFAVILTFLLQVKVALMILKTDLFYIQMTCCNLQTSFSVAVFVRYGSLLPDLEPEVHAKYIGPDYAEHLANSYGWAGNIIQT